MMATARILLHYAKARHFLHFDSRAALERWQQRQLKRFFKQVLRRSPFYQPYANQPLDRIPIVDKARMMAEFDRMNTRGLSRDQLIDAALHAETIRDFQPTLGDIAVGLSTGTSGNRGLFVTSQREREMYAGIVLAKAPLGSIFERHRIALFLRANNPLYETAGNFGRTTFRFFDLLLPLMKNVRALDTYQPTILVGASQSLRLLADAQQAGQLAIRPRVVISSAEVLDPQDATAIRCAFGCPVDQIYQATEGFLGATCRAGNLHLNEEFVHFEKLWLDVNTRHFMPVITDFTRSTQPIVRYRLDDILVERASPCPCGAVSTSLERIEGRSDDVLFFTGRSTGQPRSIMPDVIRTVLATADSSIRDYRVAQNSIDEIEIYLDASDHAAARHAIGARIKAVFEQVGVCLPRTHFHEGIHRDITRKLRRIVRQYPLPGPPPWNAS